MATPAKAQIDVGDPWEYYVRFIGEQSTASGTPSFTIRPFQVNLNDSILFPQTHPWKWRLDALDLKSGKLIGGTQPGSEVYPPNKIELFFYTPEFRVTHNNNFAWGFNDGALWQGRGLNQSHSMGFGASYRGFSMAFRPQLLFSENRHFELSPHLPRSELGMYAIARLFVDMPQRFGPDPVIRFDLGNSFIKYGTRGFEGGISHESLWLGPGVKNGIIMSNNAPGFLHGFLATEKPYKIPTGFIESRWFWGGLRESDYFDEIKANDFRYVTGFSLVYSPELAPGLHVGFNRVAYKYYPKDGLTLSDVFLSFSRLPKHPRILFTEVVDVYKERMIMSTVFARYAMPESGFELYLEWGRDDYQRRLRDVISEPALNSGYTAGFIKRFQVASNKRLVMNMEFTNLENSSPGALHRTSGNLFVNDATIWYMNNYITQGYSNRGQVLGAAIGPGSSAQNVSFTYLDTWGSFGVSGARTVYYNDRLFTFWKYYADRQPKASNTLRKLHEVEMSVGLHALVFLPMNLELEANYRYGSVENRYNVIENDARNVNVSFTLRYSIRKLSIGKFDGLNMFNR